ncbi:MAG TPA: type II CAAX endopeptidase family protein [Anaerolineales bacterium]|nr:type II CAAX endopeptidase family protein [Anaerolineales bacterium]
MNVESAKKDKRSVLARIFITPGEQRLRAGWRLVVQIMLIVVLLGLLGGLFSVGLLLAADFEYSNTLLLIGSQIITFIAFTLSVVLARRFLDRRSFASLGLQRTKHIVVDLLFGFSISGIMIGLIYLIEWGAGWLTFQGYAWQYQPSFQVVAEILVMLGIFVVVSWQEELLSRGYWLQNLSEGLNLFWGVLISSVMFALLHLGNPHMSVYAGLGLFAAGLFLAYSYTRTRQLWLAFGLHAGWNFFEGTIFGFSVSGLEGLSPLIRQSVAGPELWTGGAFGPEAGLVLLPALLLGTLLILWYTKDRK